MLTNVGYRRWNYVLLIASLSAIGVATIYPFNFSIPESLSIRSILAAFNYSSSVKDYVQNILLFIPLGVSLAAIASHRRYSIGSIIIIGCLLSGAVSSAVELTQLFLPIRVSNLTDIVCNSLGGLVGVVLYCWRKDLSEFAIGIIKADPRRLSLKTLWLAIFGYCTLVAVAIWFLIVNANLSNWNENFYLAVGNETTGDRPWNGYLNSLYLSDRSLTRSQVAAALENPDRFFDSVPTIVDLESTDGHLSSLNSGRFDLFWNDDLSISDSLAEIKTNGNLTAEGSGVLLNSKRWLQTAQPVFSVNEQLKKSNEFSLFLDLATNDLTIGGPARIITISDGIYVQNLLVGQSGQDLVFRLRTPITGSDPTQPEFFLPDFFKDYSDRQILITFADGELAFYLNREEQYSFKFNPSVSFYSYLPWNIANWRVNLQQQNLTKYRQFFYFIIIVPLIVLFGELTYFFLLKLLDD